MDVHSKHGSHLPDERAEEQSQKQAGSEEQSQKQAGAEEQSQKQAGAEEQSQKQAGAKVKDGQKMVVSEEDPDLEELLDCEC